MIKSELVADIDVGLSSRLIAQKYSKSQGSVNYWLKKFGLKTKFKQIGLGYIHPRIIRYNSQGSVYENMDWGLWQRQYESGLSWGEIDGFSNDAVMWAKENGKVKLRKRSESIKLAHISGKYNYEVYRTKEHRKIMSRFGGYKENSGRCGHISYKRVDGTKVDLQGSWEEKLAKFFDKLKVDWKRNRVGYKYIFEGKERMYFPDFFLPKLNLYVEVKGYETSKDTAKWNQFPFRLLIAKKKEIEDLDEWWKSIYTGEAQLDERQLAKLRAGEFKSHLPYHFEMHPWLE
jgi:hypothetical protein